MRRLCLIVAFVLTSTVGCRRKQASTLSATDTATATTPTPEAPAPAAPESSTTPANFGFDQRQQFVQSIHQQLTGIDQQIKDLSAEAKSRGGAVSDRALARIRADRQAVDRSLKQVDAATAANWDKLKQGVNRAVDNLSEAIEAAQPK